MTVPFTQDASAQSIAASICDSHSPLIMNALGLREQGMPLDVAEDMIPESTWGDQPRLAMFLSESIKLAYKQPAKMQNALRTRTWQAACEKSVMGVDDD